MKIQSVYLDTNIFKFSATVLKRFKPRIFEIDWGKWTQKLTVHDPIDVNPNDSLSNSKMKAEADLLPQLAEMGKSGALEYVIQAETRFELWGLPNMDSATGFFYGAPIKSVDAPIEYGRLLFSTFEDPDEMQMQFLENIDDKRFSRLQKITGAYQGVNGLNRNQLLDAWHVWCAEHNKCDFFLTLDLKLIKALRKEHNAQTVVRAVCPSELLRECGTSA